jgi:hypothetical protein
MFGIIGLGPQTLALRTHLFVVVPKIFVKVLGMLDCIHVILVSFRSRITTTGTELLVRTRDPTTTRVHLNHAFMLTLGLKVLLFSFLVSKIVRRADTNTTSPSTASAARRTGRVVVARTRAGTALDELPATDLRSETLSSFGLSFLVRAHSASLVIRQ